MKPPFAFLGAFDRKNDVRSALSRLRISAIGFRSELAAASSLAARDQRNGTDANANQFLDKVPRASNMRRTSRLRPS